MLCDSGRRVLQPTLAMFSSFFLLGVFVSALGPSVSSLSRHVGVREEAFGTVFSLRGLGYLMGSWVSALPVPPGSCTRVRGVLNTRLYRLGIATAGIGACSLGVGTAITFELICASCFCQGFCGGAIDAIANAALTDVLNAGVAPWMQGLHFCFSAGALLAPAVVGRLGFRDVFLIFGLLSQLSALACFLSEGQLLTCWCREDERGTRACRSWKPGACSLVTDMDADDGEAELVQANGGMADIDASERQPQTQDEQGRLSSIVLQDDDAAVVACSPLDPPATLPQHGEDVAKKPTLSLVALLVVFFFLYVGAEVGFGAWIAVVVLRDGLASEAGAAYMASLFWGGITAGRLLAIPLAMSFSTDLLVRVNLLGGLASSVLLLLLGRAGLGVAALGAGLLGVFMASTFPLAMSLLPSAGYALSDKNSSRMVIGAALGEMMVPVVISTLLGLQKKTWPNALYATCTVISALMIFVYAAWYRSSTLTAKARVDEEHVLDNL